MKLFPRYAECPVGYNHSVKVGLYRVYLKIVFLSGSFQR